MCVVYVVLPVFSFFLFLVCRLCSRYIFYVVVRSLLRHSAVLVDDSYRNLRI